MASLGQILGITLALFGWLGDIITCILPMWRGLAFSGNNIVVAMTMWEGLWMNCVVQSTGQMQCKVYDSLFVLSQDLQAARALTVISILVSLIGILLAVLGGTCSTCIKNKNEKAGLVISAGAFFIIGGLLCLTPVCWVARQVFQDFYNPLLPGRMMTLGASLYTGWGAAGLLLIGGTILCCQCLEKQQTFVVEYSAPTSNSSRNEFV